MTAACTRCGFDPSAPVGARWSMTFSLSVPSQNEAHNHGVRRIGGKGSKIRITRESRVYKAFREGAKWLLMSEANRLGIPRATARRRVTFTRLIGKGKRAYDHGNLVGGLKGALDAMVTTGLLVNDTERWLQDAYAQERAEADGLRIEIEELT